MSTDFITFSHVLQIPPINDWINLFFLSGIIFTIIVISEFIRRKLHWAQEVTRKLVHISVGLLLLITPLLLETSFPLLCIAVFFTVFNYIALRKNLLPGIHIDRKNLGTVYYAFSFLLLILFFWEGYKIIIIASMMTMAVGDAAAAITGHSIKKPHSYILIRDQKSWEGSIAMFLVSLVAIYATFLLYPSFVHLQHFNLVYLFFIAVLASIVATAAEALGDRGNDNLFVPLLTAIVLYFLLYGNQYFLIQFITGMILGALVALLSYRLKFLTASGAVSTFLLATVIFGFGGIKWTIPILTFFILSSILSKIGKTTKARYALIFEKGSQRDYAQVYANGGIAGILMISFVLFPAQEIYLYFLGALAAAMADTWATEIGVLVGQKPRLITTFQKVPAGTSGGITLAGLGGALLGATLISLSGIWLYHIGTSRNLPIVFIAVILGGFLGSIIDSFLGATVQIQYQCQKCGKITEKKIHCQSHPTIPITGIFWINNDVVNFLNTVFGSVFVFLILRIFK